MGIYDEMDKHEKQRKGDGYLEIHFKKKDKEGLEGILTEVTGQVSNNQMKALIIALGVNICEDGSNNPVTLFAEIAAHVMLELHRDREDGEDGD